jgi:hypothetical protein
MLNPNQVRKKEGENLDTELEVQYTQWMKRSEKLKAANGELEGEVKLWDSHHQILVEEVKCEFRISQVTKSAVVHDQPP